MVRELIVRLAYWVMGFNQFKPDFSNVDMSGIEDLKDVSKKARYYDVTNISESRLNKYARFDDNTRGLCKKRKFNNRTFISVFVKKDDMSCIIHETVHVYQYVTGRMYNNEEILKTENERLSDEYAMFLPEYYKLEKEVDARYTQYKFEDRNNIEPLHRI